MRKRGCLCVRKRENGKELVREVRKEVVCIRVCVCLSQRERERIEKEQEREKGREK